MILITKTMREMHSSFAHLSGSPKFGLGYDLPSPRRRGVGGVRSGCAENIVTFLPGFKGLAKPLPEYPKGEVL
jgi:hypothetical protein